MTTLGARGFASRLASLRTWLAFALGLLVFFVVVLIAVLWLLAHLEHPWVKGRVESVLSDALGTEVRYERLSISPFSGLEAAGLVLATPEALRSHAPEMLRIDEAHISIELRPLFAGNLVIPEVKAGAITLTVVVTDRGRSSFGELARPDGPADEPSAPLSQTLEPLSDLGLKTGPVRVAPIRVRVVSVDEDAPNAATTTTLDSLAVTSDGLVLGEELRGSVHVHADGDDHVSIEVVERDASTERRRHARVTPRLEVGLSDPGRVDASIDVRLLEQSLFPQLSKVNVLARVDSTTEFRSDEFRTTIEVRELSLLDSAVAMTASGTVGDDSTARVDAEGKVDMKTLPWRLPWLSVDDLASTFEVTDLELESGTVTSGDAKLAGRLGRLTYDDENDFFSAKTASWEGIISAPEGATRTIGVLTMNASIGRLEADKRGVYRATMSDLDLLATLEEVGVHDEGMWGLRGRGALDGSIAGLRVDSGLRVRGRNASLDLDVDLAARRVAGRVPVNRLGFKLPDFEAIALRRAELQIVAREPLRWTVDEGHPAIEVDASVARVSMGSRHVRAKGWSFDLERLAPRRYAVASRINADRVSWGRFQKDEQSSLVIEATVDTGHPAIDTSAALSIAGRSETTLELTASHDAPETRYELAIVGAHAGPILGAMLFDDGGLENDLFDFELESRGTFEGLLRTSRNGELRMSREPLRTLRGTHETTLRVEHASLARDGVLHELDGLTATAESTHEASGHGRLRAAVSFDEARYGEAGWELVLRGYRHEASASYSALYGAPSFAIHTEGSLAEASQPYFRQYPVRDVVFGADVDVSDTEVVAIREAYFRNPAGGTKLSARAAYEGLQGARGSEVCVGGTEGCPQVASIYGRKAATVTGSFDQDFSFWKSTERTKSGGAFSMPFTIETGDLNTYRVIATAQVTDLVLELPQYGLLIDDLDALIPIEQELATNPRFFIVPSRRSNAIAQKRFFDLHPFTERDSFFVVDHVQFGQENIGPVAANIQVIGATLTIDQLHSAYRGGFVTGQVLGDLSVEDPKFVFRGNITGVETTDGKGVLDANVAMTFVPTTLILEGKAQVVRISKDHLYELIDVIDPYQEDEDLNRVRLGLKFGYPKFVLLKLDEGLMNAKIDLGGLAGAVRIDEIKGIPVTPFIEQYVQPYIERLMSPTAAARAMIVENEGT